MADDAPVSPPVKAILPQRERRQSHRGSSREWDGNCGTQSNLGASSPSGNVRGRMPEGDVPLPP